jgi:hypothetical protein
MLRMSEAEAVVLHEAIAFSKWRNYLAEIELRQPVEQKVFSEIQQALMPLIPDLGSDSYKGKRDHAHRAIDPEPY